MGVQHIAAVLALLAMLSPAEQALTQTRQPEPAHAALVTAAATTALIAFAMSILRARVLRCADANLTKRAPAAMRCNWTASTAKNVTICASPSRKPGDPSPSTTHHMQNQMNTIRSTTIRAAAE